ncbi:MAG: replication-associated recombination protein A [Deltaproteobacteria bacterium]|nr:replication-associated recombination protein A [Deltaproteobacteria bacterium]
MDKNRKVPLAQRVRPEVLSDFVGQQHLLGDNGFLKRAIAAKNIPSMILWGPPGSGKTTLAGIIAREVGYGFESISAVLFGVKEIKGLVEKAIETERLFGKKTILFVDEIHHFNKSQQDALLPYVERGDVILIGATTENPSFSINSALLSRCRVLVLNSLSEDDLKKIINRVIANQKDVFGRIIFEIDDKIVSMITRYSFGDARRALNLLEATITVASSENRTEIKEEDFQKALLDKIHLYDKKGDEHYNVVSAFIKSMRGSDPDAAVYYMVRMLESGEDPLFIIRRMIIFAAEDIGNADPQALVLATSTLIAFQHIGMPEGVLPMTECAIYLSCAPKSNTSLTSYVKARKDFLEHGPLEIPLKLRNAPTALMKSLGYSSGYKYPHNFDGNYIPNEVYLPDKLAKRRYYEPTENGFEKVIKERLLRIKKRDD